MVLKKQTTLNKLKHSTQLKEEHCSSSKERVNEKAEIHSIQEALNKKLDNPQMLKKACLLIEEWLKTQKK